LIIFLVCNCTNVYEVVPYIEHPIVTLPGTVVTSSIASVSAPLVPVLGGSITLATVAAPFSNNSHVNFVFTKEMDFSALIAALGK